MTEVDSEEIVRRAMDAFNRNDLEAILEFGHEDIEINLSGAFPDLQRTYRGHEGFIEFWELFRGSWNQIWVEVKEVESRGDSVYAATVYHAVGRDDIPVERPFHFVFRLREGKFSAYETFSERERARAAAGLSG